MSDRTTAIYVFWSADGESIRMWTKDLARAQSFAKEIGQPWQYFCEAWCVDCGDGITAHDPGVCGTCYATKYERDPDDSQGRIAGQEKKES